MQEFSQLQLIDFNENPVQMKSYSNVFFKNNKVFVRGLDVNDNRVTGYLDFQPTVWVPYDFSLQRWKQDIVNQDFKSWTTFIGQQPINAVTFKDIESCKKFVAENTTVNRKSESRERETRVHTSPNNMFVTEYIAKTYPEDIPAEMDKLKIYSYDIETEIGHRDVSDLSIIKCRTKMVDNGNFEKHQFQQIETTIEDFELLPDREQWELYDEQSNQWVDYSEHPFRYIGGFPDPTQANEKITLITVQDINTKHIWTWGMENFVNPNLDEIEYRQFDNESDLLKNFVEFIEQDPPDVLLGWNTNFFDNTYVCNRVNKVLDKDWMNRLSPFGEIKFKKVEANEFGNTIIETSWCGIASLDYLKLYKKFVPGNKESYKLDAIAELELGRRKVQNPTGGGFKDFYTGKFDVKDKPKEDDHIIKKLGYQRTLLKQQLSTRPELKPKFDQLNAKIIQMCKQLFIEYNIQDVRLVAELDDKLQFINLIYTIGYMSHCNAEDVFGPVKTWDISLFYKLYHQHKVIPIKLNASKSERYPGAYVKSPLVGRHQFCESFDLDSLYP